MANNLPEIILLILLIINITISICIALKLSTIDQLTKINNAAWITKKGKSLYKKQKLDKYIAIFLNIKDYKYINEKVGNENSDQVIIQYSSILNNFLKGKGYIGRMGGDNFLIYIKKEYFNNFKDFIKEIQIKIDDEYVIPVCSRCGVTNITKDTEYKDIINRTAQALYQAKKTSQDVVVFDIKMLKSFIRKKEIIEGCQKGLNNNEFVPFYQPKINIKTNQLCGAEALVRWKKDGNIISPFYFVPILEQENKIKELDFYIFEQICKDIKKWEGIGIEPVKISSNFSKTHLEDKHFFEKIIEIKNKYNVDSKYLEIELTESSGCENIDALKNFTDKIKEEGISLSIDDFGTGYSSLSIFRNFEADTVKLDKSFLDSIDEKHSSKVFLKDIIKMISNQEKNILCEGVETKEQLEILQKSGCDIVQGFLYDKPLPIEEFENRLQNPIYK